MKGKKRTAVFSLIGFLFSFLWPYLAVPAVAEANAPAISITSPTEGQKVFTDSVVLNANITNGTVTDVYQNGVRLSSTTLPMTINYLNLGQNTLKIRASNDYGISEAVVNVFYDDEPQLTNLSPVHGSTVSGDFTVTGQYENTSSLIIKLNNNQIWSQIFSPPLLPGTIPAIVIPAGSMVVGTNTISFEASNGTKTITKSIQITYAPPSPTVFNVTPADGSKVFSSTVTLSGQVSAGTTSLTVQNVTTGGSPITVPLSGTSFSTTVNLAPGVSNLIRFTPGSPAPGIIKDVTIIQEKRPQVSITEPSEAIATTVNTFNKTVFWTSPNITIKGRIDNASYAAIKVNNGADSNVAATGDFSRTVDLLAGANEIKVWARNSEPGDTAVTLTVYYNGAPGLTITNPANTAVTPTVYNSKFTVTGRVTNTKTLTVQRAGGSEETVSFDSQGNFSKQITLVPGQQSVTVKASDGSATTVKSFSLYFDDTPYISVTAPASGTSIAANKVTVSGNVQNADTNGFYINGQQTYFDSNGNFSREITLSPGASKIELKAQKGNRITIKEVPITYSGKAEIVINSPGDKTTTYSNVITVSGYLLGMSAPYDKVELKVNNIATTVDNNGNFSQRVTLKQGVNTVTASMKSGGATSKSIKVTYVDLAVPGAVFATNVPQNGGNIKAFENQVNLNIPKGVLPGESKLTFEVIDPKDVAKNQETVYVSQIFEIEGYRDELVKPVTLTLQYINGLKEAQANKVALYYYDDGDWEPIVAKVDAKKRTVTAEVDKLGKYAVMTYIQTFNDVIGHWAQNDIEIMLAKGIASGKSSYYFNPDTNITRAEFTKFLVEALGIPKYDAVYANFDDVDDDYWAYKYIQGAVRVGIVKGTSAYRFSPEKPITRAEAAAMIARAAGFKSMKEDEVKESLDKFKDRNQIGKWAQSSIAEAMKAGIINGYSPDSFRPNSYTTRAQAARMIVRLMIQQKKI